MDVSPGWLPKGYRLVTDPNHILLETDAVLPRLSTDWRLVSTINSGKRVGLMGADAGSDLMYIATVDSQIQYE